MASRAATRRAITTALPWLLALAVLLLSMRGAFDGALSNTDSTRHFMNGALVHDMVRDGGLADPWTYAHRYYSRLPAISLPYHPPMFPALEAAVFAVTGVSVTAARAIVAFAAASSALLLFTLVRTTHGSPWLAGLSVAALFSLPLFRFMSLEVMLEMPALAMCLGAFVSVATPQRIRSWRNGLLFGLLAGAAVLTKQNAAFAGLVPVAAILLTRRFDLLKSGPLWLGVGTYALAVAAWVAVSAQVHNTGIDYLAPWDVFGKFVARNARFYGVALWQLFGAVSLGVLAAVAALHWLARKLAHAGTGARWQASSPYVAWASTALAFPLVAHHSSMRYAFFSVPPLVVLACALLLRATTTLAGTRAAPWAASALVAAFFVSQADLRLPHTRGPEKVAARLVDGRPKRILYCGITEGQFVAAARVRDPGLQTIVIRGDKLYEGVFERASLTRFLREYGIDYVVVELGPRPNAWDDVNADTIDDLVPVADEIVESTRSDLQGTRLFVYRFSSPSPTPAREMAVRLNPLGGQRAGSKLEFGTPPGAPR